MERKGCVIKLRDFDKEAASWDDNPRRVKLANDVSDAILLQAEVRRDMDILDFGCGTGLITFRLLPHVNSVTCVDSSSAMLDVVRSKASGKSNVRTIHLNMDEGHVMKGSFDLIVSSMTLHHIKDVPGLIKRFYTLTAHGGYLCLADLDSEGGRFHSDNTGVFHHGFDRAGLKEIFVKAGYSNVRDITAAAMAKPGPDGSEREFTVFLMTGTKEVV